MERFSKDFKEIRKAQLRDFEHPEIEYNQILVKHYNNDPLKAFPMLVMLRDELKIFISDRENELKSHVTDIQFEAKRYLKEEDKIFYDRIVDGIGSILHNQIKNPTPNLYYEVEFFIEENASDNHWIYNRFPYESSSMIVEFEIDTKYFRRSLALYNVAFGLVRDILLHSLPVKFELDKRQINEDAYTVEIPVEKPHRDEIYKWFGELRHNSNNNIEEAFSKLCSLITERGLELSEYIKTDTPENFDRAYRKFLNKRNKGSDNKGT
ncbi:MAG: hypothetical protein JJ895_06530 [Balneolaceae bacterium]|nr:hypothetical protein [Balneolaceae bacterium]